METIKSPTRILIVALALGLCYDLLFHGHALGVSLPLFVLLLVAALLWLGRSAGVRPAWRNLWLLVPLFFVAGMVAVRANATLTFFNVAAMLALLALLAHYFAAGRLERSGLVGYALAGLRSGANALFQAAPLVKEALARRSAPTATRRNAWPLVRGLLLALPVLAVFTCLLSSADLVFGRYVANLLGLRFWQELVGRALVVLLAAWLLAGALAYSLRRGSGDSQGGIDRALDSLAVALRPSTPPAEDGLQRLLAALAGILGFGMVEAAIVLLAVDLLFAAFVGIQFAYLFGGQANVTAQGYTYAEYARRGFFELVSVAVLALGLGLGLRWLTRRETPRQSLAFSALSSLLGGLVLVMLASAFQRLRLYELAYGFTETRLSVYVFMVWLGAALAWFVVTLWRLPNRFAVGALVAALGFLVTLNAINPDAFVARRNLERYYAGAELDAAYLTRLSDDAVPVLLEAVGRTSGGEQSILERELGTRRALAAAEAAQQGWPAWHLARWRAYTLLIDN
ncbi:MAG TPA: DUF4173 domain-containing protein [Anaerolineae bacterium]|nr:DUF4173 domain-containing protein [Anaerolineae bacterium]